MRRCVARLAIFLLLIVGGAIINIATAILIAAYLYPVKVPLFASASRFAVETLVYAAMLGLGLGGFELFRIVRGRARIKRGQCATCGYPVGLLGTSAVCSECGTPRPPVRAAQPHAAAIPCEDKQPWSAKYKAMRLALEMKEHPTQRKTSRIKRLAFKLLALILAGAIINVALAWGCVLNRSWSSRFGITDHFRTFGPFYGLVAFEAGFPQRCLHGRIKGENGQAEFEEVLVLGSRIGHQLPLSPIWPGFAINTIFYAAIVWMLFTVPGAVRRRVRIRRGQCASCGYSLRGTPDIEKCPECGALSPQRGAGM